MKVYFLSPADQELDDAYVYYEDQMAGLGLRFFNEVSRTIELIQRTPMAWRKVAEHTRRINIKRFPYFILYIFEKNTIFITCIAHAHRDPKYYLSRLQ